MIGTLDSPTTALSAKLITMKKNTKATTVQARRGDRSVRVLDLNGITFKRSPLFRRDRGTFLHCAPAGPEVEGTPTNRTVQSTLAANSGYVEA